MNVVPSVEVRGLEKSYGDRQALRHLEFSIRAGEIYGLLGSNGAGKSTTINLLMGLLRPTGGAAFICGHHCTNDATSVRRLVGHMPEEPVLYDNLTGREILAFVLRMRSLSVEDGLRGIEPTIERLAFQADIDQLVAGYSMGMRKKLALLVALVHEPPVLLLDEPTNGLDPVIAREVRELLIARARAGGIVLLSTHLLEVAHRLCDRIGVLAGGMLRAEGTPDEVIATVPGAQTLEDAFLVHSRAANARDNG